jgi:hypothetical protein
LAMVVDAECTGAVGDIGIVESGVSVDRHDAGSVVIPRCARIAGAARSRFLGSPLSAPPSQSRACSVSTIAAKLKTDENF